MKSTILFSLFILLISSCTINNNDEKQDNPVIEQNSKIETLAIKAFNGKYLCSEKNRTILANRDDAYLWETFLFVWSENNELAIMAYDKYFLSVDQSLSGEITSTRKEKNETETFTIEYLNDNFVAIKATNLKYFSIDTTTLKLAATAEKIGEREKFKLTKVN